jgi:hypothetical protein
MPLTVVGLLFSLPPALNQVSCVLGSRPGNKMGWIAALSFIAEMLYLEAFWDRFYP